MTSKNTFIQHPISGINGHLITLGKLLSDLEDKANIGCGQYFEIFEDNLIREATYLLNKMESEEQKLFCDFAKQKGYAQLETPTMPIILTKKHSHPIDNIPF